jgi:replicative DNA helicase
MLVRGASVLDSVFLWAAERRARPGKVWGLPTGFSSWDELTGGLHRGEVTVIGARTSVGKTTLALQVSLAALRSGPVLYFSPEMGPEQLVLRILAMEAAVSPRSLAQGLLSDLEWEQVEKTREELRAVLDRLVLFCSGADLVSLEQRLEESNAVDKLSLVVIDYLQLIKHQAFSPYERATEVSRRIRELANRLSIPVLLLSQLRRPEGGKEDQPPSLHDLRDSGNIEQDADNVLLLWRPPVEDGNGKLSRSNLTIVELAKQRNGPVGSFKLLFVPERFRFEDLGTT